jgi:GNAT superfamily N-acetyltransferase
MSSITVRQAVLSDLEELGLLFNAYRMFQGKESDLSAALAFLHARFDHGESIAFLAHEGSVALGFAQLYPSYSSTALARVFILNDLFVHESARRKGAASRLLSAVEAYAWGQGAARVTLNVAVENTQGQALYEAQGWSKDAQFFMYHRYPASR